MVKQLININFLIGLFVGVLLSGIVLVINKSINNSRLTAVSLSTDTTFLVDEIDNSIDDCAGIFRTPTVGSTTPINSLNKGRIDINSASIVELESLPGVGPEKAKAIVRFREAYGLFLSVEELDYVPGINENMVEQFRNLVITCPAP